MSMNDRSGFRLEWGPPEGSETSWVEHAPIGSREELDAKLDALERAARKGKPLIAELVEPRAGTLGIGLGSDVSVVYFNRADGEPPYLISSGDSALADHRFLVFFYAGVWTEFPPETAIHPDAARDAMREFLRTRRRPQLLSWLVAS